MAKVTATFAKSGHGWAFSIFRDGVCVRQSWCAGSKLDATTAADYEIRIVKGEIVEHEHDIGGEG